MGADLYIKKINTKVYGFEVSNNAVNGGYFRDCYNSGGMFFRLSKNTGTQFSWWQTANRKELFNKKSEMSVKGAKILLSEIETAKNKLNLDNLNEFEYLKTDKNGETIYKKSKMSDDSKIFFLEHLDLFIKFLNIAIQSKSVIEWSV